MLVLVTLAACTPSQTTGIAGADEFAGRWYDAGGMPLPDRVLHAAVGPAACGWDSVVLLDIVWPPGSRASAERREFVRDPYGKVGRGLAGRFEGVATLPADARDTGFHHGIWRLSFADSEPSDVYVVGPSKTERWPLAPSTLACATPVAG